MKFLPPPAQAALLSTYWDRNFLIHLWNQIPCLPNSACVSCTYVLAETINKIPLTLSLRSIFFIDHIKSAYFTVKIFCYFSHRGVRRLVLRKFRIQRDRDFCNAAENWLHGTLLWVIKYVQEELYMN